VDQQSRSQEPVGRSWSAKELRRKSYQDLHKLWYVLYKEKNMLLTEQQLSRRRQVTFPQPERLYKVQKSMGAIKQVLGERKREKVAVHLASQMEKAMMAESQEQTEEVDTATKTT
jgi:large subunit ribosomal protein L47